MWICRASDRGRRLTPLANLRRRLRAGSGASRLVVLATAALALACEASPPATSGPTSSDPAEIFRPVRLVDAAGRSLDLTKAPTRIVSLVPSVSAIFLALGEAGRLAGRTDYDTAQSFSELPSVGGGLQPSLEVLVSLQPDLVIRFAGPSDPSTPERLDDLGIAHYAVRPDGISDVKRIIQEMGLVSGRALTADSIVAEIDEALVDIAVRVAPYPPVRTAFVLGGTPPIVAGPGTFVHELIRLGGGINVFSDLTDLYAPVSAEEIVARGADVYLTVPGSTFDASLVPRTPVREVSEGAQLPGPNLGSIAREVARALHPEAFP